MGQTLNKTPPFGKSLRTLKSPSGFSSREINHFQREIQLSMEHQEKRRRGEKNPGEDERQTSSACARLRLTKTESNLNFLKTRKICPLKKKDEHTDLGSRSANFHKGIKVKRKTVY